MAQGVQRLCRGTRGFPVAVGPQEDGGRDTLPGSRQPSVSIFPGLGQGTQALRHRAGVGSYHQLQPQHTKCVVSLHRVCPQGAPQSWCSGVLTAQAKQDQPFSRLLVPRVQLSPAGPDTLSSGPLPSQRTGALSCGAWTIPARAPQGTFSL